MFQRALTVGSGDGGDITIKTGTLNVSASSLTFDCGFEPDMVYMVQVRATPIDNDWYAFYQKASAFDNLFPNLEVCYLSMCNQWNPSATQVNYKLSVSGSVVTFPNYSNFYGSTWNWIAFKKN